MRLGIVRVEFQRTSELLIGALPVIFKVSFFRPQRGVGLGKVVVQFQGSGSRCLGLWVEVLWGPNCVSKVGIGKSGIGQSETGVLFRGALEISRALIDLLEGALVQGIATFEIKLVSLRIWSV